MRWEIGKQTWIAACKYVVAGGLLLGGISVVVAFYAAESRSALPLPSFGQTTTSLQGISSSVSYQSDPSGSPENSTESESPSHGSTSSASGNTPKNTNYLSSKASSGVSFSTSTGLLLSQGTSATTITSTVKTTTPPSATTLIRDAISKLCKTSVKMELAGELVVGQRLWFVSGIRQANPRQQQATVSYEFVRDGIQKSFALRQNGEQFSVQNKTYSRDQYAESYGWMPEELFEPNFVENMVALEPPAKEADGGYIVTATVNPVSSSAYQKWMEQLLSVAGVTNIRYERVSVTVKLNAAGDLVRWTQEDHFTSGTATQPTRVQLFQDFIF